MRKYLAIIGLLVFSGALSAQSTGFQTTKGLSFGVSMGIRPDMAQLGETIVKDGTLETARGTMARDFYSTSEVFMSDRKNMIVNHNSDNTNSSVRPLASHERGGSLLGGEMGFTMSYEDRFGQYLPVFVRTGFFYTSSMGGGNQERTLGDVSTRNSSLRGLIAANGLNPEDFAGGKMTTQWRASWYEIPITIGFQIPVTKHTNIYAGLGISIFNGGFGVDVNMDEKYANVLSTYVDTNALTVKNYHKGGNIQQEVDFQATVIGLNYLVGVQSQISDDWALFLELNFSGGAATVFNNKLDGKTQATLTSSQSETLASGVDPNWFKRLAFPVVMSGASARFGAKMYIDL